MFSFSSIRDGISGKYDCVEYTGLYLHKQIIHILKVLQRHRGLGTSSLI